jgi:hypothetical protein
MSTLPSGFTMLMFLVSAEPRRVEPTPQEIASYHVPTPAELPPSDAPSPLFRILGVGLFAASAADFATTEWGLSRGLREGNPVASERGARLLHHVAGPAVVHWTTERLQRSGREKLALGIRLGLMVAYSYAAIHNLRQSSAVPQIP